MTEPTKNVDRTLESEVAIAAQSTLEAAREAARNLDAPSGSNPKSGRVSTRGVDGGKREPMDPGDQIPLIMGALEKLATATDHMAQQLGERLEEVRTEFAHDLQEVRGDDLRQALQDREQEWSGQWSGMRGELDELRAEVRQIGTNLDRLVTMLAQKTESLAERVQDSRDEVREEVQSIRRSLQEDLGEARAGILEAVDQQIDAIRAEVERNRDENAKGQRSTVNDLAEGIGLAQASLDKRFDQLETVLDEWRKNQDERLTHVERESQKIGELGLRLDRNHQEMMDLFEQEKHRAEQIEQDRQRDQARRLNNSGVARYHSGDFERARRLFEQAVELDRNFAEAFNNLGLCLTEIGDHDEATVAFEAAIELNPDLGASYNNLGYVLYLQENFEAAIEMYKEAIGRKHDTSAAYTNLGNAYQKLRETEKAVDSWRQALEIDPTNERAQQYLERFAGGPALATPSYPGSGRGA